MTDKKLNSENSQNHPFKVPDGYFQQLSEDILERKSALNNKREWYQVPKFRYALASLVIIVISLITFYSTGNEDSYDTYLAQVSTDEIIDYLQIYDLSEEDILYNSELGEGEAFDFFDESQLEEHLDELEFNEDDLDELLYDIDFENNTQEI